MIEPCWRSMKIQSGDDDPVTYITRYSLETRPTALEKPCAKCGRTSATIYICTVLEVEVKETRARLPLDQGMGLVMAKGIARRYNEGHPVCDTPECARETAFQCEILSLS